MSAMSEMQTLEVRATRSADPANRTLAVNR